MKSGRLVLSAVIAFSILPQAAVATPIAYSLTGVMAIRATDWDPANYYPIEGEMAISDIPIPSGCPRYFCDYEISSFAMRVGEYNWSGTGLIQYRQYDTYYTLNGMGDFGSQSTRGENPGYALWEPLDIITFPEFGWYIGDGFYSRVVTLAAARIPVVEPSTLILFITGLLPFAGREWRKRRE